MGKVKRVGQSAQKRKNNTTRSPKIRELSPAARSWLDKATDGAIEGNNTAADDSLLVTELLQLPPAEIPASIHQYARETEALGLPLLQYLTTTGNASLTVSAVEALGLVGEIDAAAILGSILRGTSDRNVRKAARKSLMRLKSLGLEVEDFLVDTRTPLDFSQFNSENASAWISNIDGAGDQMVVLCKTVPMEGPYVIHVITSDQVGIASCMGGQTSRRRLSLFIDELQREGNVVLQSCDPEYARYLIQDALSKSHTVDHPVPREFASLRFLLGDLDQPIEMPSISKLLEFDPSAVDREDAEGSRALVRSGEFPGWLFSLDKVQRFIEQIKEVEEGWIVTSEEVKKDRVKHIIDAAADFLFSMDYRQTCKQRLERMAYFLHLRGKDDLARNALTVATFMGDENRQAHSLEFARILVAGSILINMETREATGETSDAQEDEQRVVLKPETASIIRASYFGEDVSYQNP